MSEDKSSVYKLKSVDCGTTYIGQTGGNFKTGIEEHIAGKKKHTKTSRFAAHLVEKSSFWYEQFQNSSSLGKWP